MAARSRQYVLRARAESVERTRERVLEVARAALFSLPFEELTLPAVAASAGVTTQTVRNHFDSKDGLLRALSDSISADLEERRRTAAPPDSAAVAAMLVSEYEEYGKAAARLLLAADRFPVMAEMAQNARGQHLRWLTDTFAARLPEDERARRTALAGLYAATDVGTWRLLRLDLRHSRRMTTEVIRSLIDGVLGDD